LIASAAQAVRRVPLPPRLHPFYYLLIASHHLLHTISSESISEREFITFYYLLIAPRQQNVPQGHRLRDSAPFYYLLIASITTGAFQPFSDYFAFYYLLIASKGSYG